MKLIPAPFSFSTAVTGHAVLLASFLWHGQAELPKPAAPVMTTVSLIAAPPQPAPVVAPPQPTPSPPKPVEPRKQTVRKSHKPTPVKPKPVVRRTENSVRTAKQAVAVEEDFDDVPRYEPSAAAASAAPANSAPSGAVAGGAETPPSFHANYLSNPQPPYPALSRRMGEEGKVFLKVSVNADGRVTAISIHRSSGYPRLDQAAHDAVQRWRFVPAKRGNTPVAGQVIVPINFNLQ